jgi:hypothetical protein
MMSGINYEVAIRELSLEHLRQIWATFASSFALIYVDANDNDPLHTAVTRISTQKPLVTLKLVEGHGRPYGTTYGNLEAIQGVLNPDTKLVPLGNGIFMRFLTRIPTITDELKIDENPFYAQRPIMYFASNSQSTEVTEWVFGDGLLNFALVPCSIQQAVPDVRFTPRYAFLTQSLYLNMDLHFKPVQPDKAREVIALGIQTNDWPYDRHQYFLEYRNFGNYSTPTADIKVPEETALIVDAVKKIEKAIDQDIKDASAATDSAGTAAKDAAAKASAEVTKLNEAASGQKLADEDEPITL